MLVFPQLTTGAAALYPMVRRQRVRTVLGRTEDGHCEIFRDVDYFVTEWDLHMRGLVPSEWEAIRDLFQQTKGQLLSFSLLEPAGNLLARSEDFLDTAWLKDSALVLTSGQTDPFGTTRAIRIENTSGSTGIVRQTLDVPGNFVYCFSIWARSASNTNIALTIHAGSVTVSKPYVVGSTWRRIFVSGTTASPSASEVQFGATLAAGAVVDLFAAQAEAQPAPSDYQLRGATSGVHRVRFATDELTVTAQATEVFDTLVRLVSVED